MDESFPTKSADKPLFTPGPLTTSTTVKQAMLRELGSRDRDFIATVRRVRQKFLNIAGVSRDDGYEAILLQGSGTFGIEAVLTSAVSPDGKWLIVINGAYGDRMAKIASRHKIDHAVLKSPEDTQPDPTDIDQTLTDDPRICAVAVVHCETTTGIMNPAREIADVVARHGKVYFVDSMSAFGGVHGRARRYAAKLIYSPFVGRPRGSRPFLDEGMIGQSARRVSQGARERGRGSMTPAFDLGHCGQFQPRNS